MKRVTIAVMTLAAGLSTFTTGGCGSEPADPEMDRSRPSEFSFQKSTQASLVGEGREAYETYCIGCHGAEGDGRGVAAGFLDPLPRNFQAAQFKFNSRGVGELPTDEDLKRTIQHGLKGSAMPAFRMLQDRTLESLIAYIKTFSPRWKEEVSGQPITYVDDPWRMDEDKTEAIKRGELVYHGFAGCWSCHPAYVSTDRINDYLVMMNDQRRSEFREDIGRAIGKADAEGNILYPPDFKRDFVRSGMSIQDLYRSIGAGIQGSAMPKWLMSIEYQPDENEPPLTTKSDVWAMAYYVQDLIRQRPDKLEDGTFEVRERAYVIYPDGVPEDKPVDADTIDEEGEEPTRWEDEDEAWPDEEGGEDDGAEVEGWGDEDEGDDGAEIEGWGDETDGDDGPAIEGWGDEGDAGSEEAPPADADTDGAERDGADHEEEESE